MQITLDVRQSDNSPDRWAVLLEQGVAEGMPVVGEVLREFVAQRFETQTDPWGAPWAAHSPVTVMIRRRRGTGASMRKLVERGTLMGSFAYEVRNNGRRVVIFAGGAAAPYAAVHQRGNPNNRIYGKAPAPIPARPILPLRGEQPDMPPALLEEIRETMLDAIRASLARSQGSSGAIRVRRSR